MGFSCKSCFRYYWLTDDGFCVSFYRRYRRYRRITFSHQYLGITTKSMVNISFIKKACQYIKLSNTRPQDFIKPGVVYSLSSFCLLIGVGGRGHQLVVRLSADILFVNSLFVNTLFLTSCHTGLLPEDIVSNDSITTVNGSSTESFTQYPLP